VSSSWPADRLGILLHLVGVLATQLPIPRQRDEFEAVRPLFGWRKVVIGEKSHNKRQSDDV
jgi:hypothetical protein